ncbi:MAG: SemiSWEET transporter [Burkholderiales bacterium]|nr:SemiSWEET transporter [Burkholderiales bacterium]
MTTADAIGLLAGVLTTLAFVPQVIRVWRTRSARDLSLASFAIFTVGVALWLVYGIAVGALPVIVANAVTLVLAGAILVMKLAFDRAKRRR